jgi:hypothetical protein
MNIKGHTDIILTDVNTGEVERHSDDNLVTNALKYLVANGGFLSPTVLHNPIGTNDFTIKDMLGGLLLFDKEIDENKDNVLIPPGVSMVGNGAIDVASNDEVLEFGSYSSSESGWTDSNTFTQVYDFTTQQANGKIASVCLTSKAFGELGAGNSLSEKSKNNIYNGVVPKEIGLNYDDLVTGGWLYKYENNKIYGISLDDDSKELTFYKVDCPFDTLDLRFNNSNVKKTEIKKLDLTAYRIKDNYGKSVAFFHVDAAYNITLAFCDYSFTNYEERYYITTPILFLTIDTANYTVSSEYSYTDADVINMGKHLCHPMATDNFMLLSTDTKFFIINKSDHSVTEYTPTFTNFYPVLGNIYIHGDVINTDMWRFDLTIPKLFRTNGTEVAGHIYGAQKYYLNLNDNPLLLTRCAFDYSNPNAEVKRYLGYLATINNLSEPVVKDSTKTMKVIYTLKFED